MKAVTGEVIEQRGVLTAREQQQLSAAELDIEKGGSLIVSGLQLIRDKRLYRVTHDTFEDYCRERWQRTASAVNKAIRSEQVVQAVADQMGKNFPQISHGAAAEVDDLPTETAVEVVKKATENGQKPTAKAVKAARETVAPKEPPTKDERRPSGGTTFNPDEWTGADYSTEKKKATDAIGAALRRLDDLHNVCKKNALHQKALGGLNTAFEEVSKW